MKPLEPTEVNVTLRTVLLGLGVLILGIAAFTSFNFGGEVAMLPLGAGLCFASFLVASKP